MQTILNLLLALALLLGLSTTPSVNITGETTSPGVAGETTSPGADGETTSPGITEP